MGYAVKRLLIAVLLIALALSAQDLKAREKSKLLGLLVDQAGSSTVILTLKGTNLPLPELESQEMDSLRFRMAGTELPASTWERGLDIPLAPKVIVKNEGSDVVIQLLTSAPMEVTGRKGPAGADTVQITAERLFPAEPPMDAPIKEPPVIEGQDALKIVTLDFRDAEIHDVLRLLAAYMDLNVVISPSVPKSRVTVALREVPLGEALEYVVRLYQLSYVRRGKTLMVGPCRELGKVLGKTVFKDYPIGYGEPQRIAAMLRQMTDIGSAPEDLVIDERLRTLHIRGTPAQHDEIFRLIRQLDRPGSQVMIKARILEINDNASDEFEAIVNAVYDNWWMSFAGDSFAGGSYNARTSSSGSVSNPAPDGGALDTTELPGFENTLWGLAGQGIRLLDAGISSIVQENKGRLLADPTVVVLSGHKAEVKLVDQLKYVSRRDDAGNPTYDDEEVGPQLEIVPIVGRNNLVTVDVRLATGEISSWLRGSQGEQIPQTTKREVSSKVIVHSGEPFVVGGLFKENRARTASRVPILSDIPLLGSLFRSRSGETRRSQVIMILIPYILSFPE